MQKSKKKQPKQPKQVARSRSRSLSPARSNPKPKPKPSKKNPPVSSRGRIKSKPSPAQLAKSQSKKKLNKSQSDKKLNRSSSLPRIGSSPNTKLPATKPQPSKSTKTPALSKPLPKSEKPPVQQSPSSSLKSEQKEMGLIFMKPEFDRIAFKPLQSTDPVFDRYLEMVSNDNDANYMMNALPELRSFKKEEDTESKDFVSGRVSRLSGMFQNLTVDKVITAMKRVPNYYSGPCGKNLATLRVLLQTKFKVQVDIGFLQYSLDGDKLTLFRIYLSKIYRRMNYIGYVYLQTLKMLIQRHPVIDRISIFILERNLNIHKFFKYLGFHIEQVASESKNKTVDYFQELAIRKKEMGTVLASMG